MQKVLPIHLQLSPTNKCNFHCPYCSCSSRDKSLELPLSKIEEFMKSFIHQGGKSVTITGGGDPLLHKDIMPMLDSILAQGVRVGIVCNGSLWDRLRNFKRFDEITWIRVSSSDYMAEQLQQLGKDYKWWLKEQERMVEAYPNVDWAFSYVVASDTPAVGLIAELVDFANDHNLTHVRLVSDILNAGRLFDTMSQVKNFLRNNGVDDGIVNYQDRASYRRGTNPCYLSLLKPVLAADGCIYPCCGVQYALRKPTRDFEPKMNMGSMADFDKMIEEQQFFNGSNCVKCYYSNYNDALNVLLNGVEHEEFI